MAWCLDGAQTIIWTNDGILLIGPIRTNFSEILIGIQTFSFKKMHLKMSSAKWCPFCIGLNVLSNVLALKRCQTISRTNDDSYPMYTWSRQYLLPERLCWIFEDSWAAHQIHHWWRQLATLYWHPWGLLLHPQQLLHQMTRWIYPRGWSEWELSAMHR